MDHSNLPFLFAAEEELKRVQPKHLKGFGANYFCWQEEHNCRGPNFLGGPIYLTEGAKVIKRPCSPKGQKTHPGGGQIAFIQRLNCHFIQESWFFQNLRRANPLFPRRPSFYAENLLVGKGLNILLLEADISGIYQGLNFCVCGTNLHSEGWVTGNIFSGSICWRLTFSGLVNSRSFFF